MSSAEKENVFRVLKDEPLLVTSFWCRFGWHRWLKWSEPKKDGIHAVQTRTCSSCNLWSRRRKDDF
jgi:hypothetical protein